MRDGKPDWLLLKRGDTFTPSAGGVFTQWKLSGASATAPMVVGSYDPSQPGVVNPYAASARPVVENADNVSVLTTAGGGTGKDDYLALVGIEFYNYTADPFNGSYNPSWVATEAVFLGTAISWSLVEDCKFSFYEFNIDVEAANNSNPNASTSVLIFNRNIVINAYSASAGNSSGLYLGTSSGNSVVANAYLTENIFDHNGWNATVSGAGPSSHNHNLYVECATSTVQPTNSYETITDNIFSNDSAVSAMRLPGTYTNNLLAYVPNGMSLGADTATAASCNNPSTTAAATQNVIIDANYNASVVGGGGFGTLNMTSPANMTNNVISTYASTNLFGYGLQINTPNSDNTFTNNTVWDWTNAIQNNGGTGHVLTPNDYNCTTCNSGGAYSDPYRSVGSYYATLSGATSSAVVTGAINNGSASAGNILTVTGITSGALNVGDAITFPGQSNAVVITGNSTIGSNLCGSACTGTGGTGTYAVNIANGSCSGSAWSSCTPVGAVSLLVTSQTLTDYSYNGFIAKAATSSKGSDIGNAYRACLVNDYIRAGFGLAAQGCPTNG